MQCFCANCQGSLVSFSTFYRHGAHHSPDKPARKPKPSDKPCWCRTYRCNGAVQPKSTRYYHSKADNLGGPPGQYVKGKGWTRELDDKPKPKPKRRKHERD
ncbi:uncharacterized protein PFL1_03083 [Pseudozyma flocculosa PF-1]|uniref:C2H2-type domain-containing protein n=1 Tax=Pseudozyma flocculosa PF-1 TaxID=1277687 RepID=A0A061H9M6_9BASI|nr:uncharacterized protein PFL1_03083 [Pseudozyma flocculosa PF-1]EPQ29328.1 hypothetical protein PFL1_03083 [Pseudozyma flocculosa PF-1]